MPYFTHLHLHTRYSVLDGASKISDLMKKAKAFGMDAMAITDHGNMYGVMEFVTEANPVHSPNAKFPIEVTLSGIVTDIKLLQP